MQFVLKLIMILVGLLLSGSIGTSPTRVAADVSDEHSLELVLQAGLMRCPCHLPPQRNREFVGFGESGFEEEDTDEVERPLSVSQIWFDFDTLQRPLPLSGSCSVRSPTRTPPVESVLRC